VLRRGGNGRSALECQACSAGGIILGARWEKEQGKKKKGAAGILFRNEEFYVREDKYSDVTNHDRSVRYDGRRVANVSG